MTVPMIEAVNMNEKITDWQYPFDDLDEETKELINSDRKCRGLYETIISMPRHKRVYVANACLMVLEGKATAEQMIELHERFGRESDF